MDRGTLTLRKQSPIKYNHVYQSKKTLIHLSIRLTDWWCKDHLIVRYKNSIWPMDEEIHIVMFIYVIYMTIFLLNHQFVLHVHYQPSTHIYSPSHSFNHQLTHPIHISIYAHLSVHQFIYLSIIYPFIHPFLH